MKTKKKNQHGGAGRGGGRKPEATAKVTITIRVDPGIYAWLQKKRAGRTMGATIEKALLNFMDAENKTTS